MKISKNLKIFDRTRGISSSLLRKKSAKIHFLENKENLTWKKGLGTKNQKLKYKIIRFKFKKLYDFEWAL